MGENSTGKSSFLALVRIALELVDGNLKPNFNREPFFLGAYDQIAHYRGGPYGRAHSFKIALCHNTPPQSDIPPQQARIDATFAKQGSQAALSDIGFSFGNSRVKFPLSPSGTLFLTSPPWSGEIPRRLSSFATSISSGTLFEPHYLVYGMRDQSTFLTPEDRQRFEQVDMQALLSELDALAIGWRALKTATKSNPYAIAPVRTKPERTYNPIDDTPRSEGAHVPMVLAKTRFTDKRKWDRIKAVLDEFGNASGLFQQLTLKTLGRSDSDPFQIMIKISGPSSNLIDVGYGVSQVLPIIVDLAEGHKGRSYLLQQPEVHLHPRGQAALGTFLCDYVKKSSNQVVVETHSDHLIDRVRRAVREGNSISNDEVSILFFERKGRGVRIHQLELDENGNLHKAPPTYRKFFLDEENSLFGL